jgi:hypothetical protein
MIGASRRAEGIGVHGTPYEGPPQAGGGVVRRAHQSCTFRAPNHADGTPNRRARRARQMAALRAPTLSRKAPAHRYALIHRVRAEPRRSTNGMNQSFPNAGYQPRELRTSAVCAMPAGRAGAAPIPYLTAHCSRPRTAGAARAASFRRRQGGSSPSRRARRRACA